ncbi:hypothetical protein [Acidiferrobacter thiooxydans]
MTIPALHLWWRYTWRMALIPLVILLFGTFSLAIFVMILAHVAPYVIEFFALLLVIGGRYGTVSPPSLFSAMWVLLAPFLAIYGIWLFQDRLLSEPFQYRGQFWSFRIVEGSTALTYPLAGKTAFALWWAFLWRMFFTSVVAALVLLMVAPSLHFPMWSLLVHLLGGYFSLWWLLKIPYKNMAVIQMELLAGYVSAWWLLTAPYGTTRIKIERWEGESEVTR